MAVQSVQSQDTLAAVWFGRGKCWYAVVVSHSKALGCRTSVLNGLLFYCVVWFLNMDFLCQCQCRMISGSCEDCDGKVGK